jgi:3-phosphoshikimate 1-carboxyvinyltransferase
MASAANFPKVYGPIGQGRVAGRLGLPGSKSITQRYFNLALLHGQALRVRRPLLSEDTELYLQGLQQAGFAVRHLPGAVEVTPGEVASDIAADGEARRDVFCGAGGTMFRFLTAALAAIPGRFTLDGIPRLRERPIAPLVDALRPLGAQIRYLGREGFAPLAIDGETLEGGRTLLDAGASSQFLSALLMAALRAKRETVIELTALTSEPYVDLTLDAIAEFGGQVDREGSTFRVTPGRSSGELDEVAVEPDFSAVGYPAGAAVLTGGEIFLEGCKPGSRQGDRGFVEVLAALGARVRWHDDGLAVAAPADGVLRAVDLDLEAMPDQVPTLAALAPFARGNTVIRNVPNLRIKESDRLTAMATELRKAGVPVEELPDGLVVPGVFADGVPPSNAVLIETWGDHRIAMAMALVGLRRPGLSIHHPYVVAKSYPAFWSDLERLQSKAGVDT